MISGDSRKWFLGDMGNQARHQLTLGDRSLNKTTCQFIFFPKTATFGSKISEFLKQKRVLIGMMDGSWVFFSMNNKPENCTCHDAA